jgi:hypothetical protein
MGVEVEEEEEETLQEEEVVPQEEEVAPQPFNQWPPRCNKQPKEEEDWMDTHQTSSMGTGKTQSHLCMTSQFGPRSICTRE